MTVLNKHHGNIPADAVYIGRGSYWGNPFVIDENTDRNKACDLYEASLKVAIDQGDLTAEELATLHGKDLVCFCAPARCHGHTLEAFASVAHEFLNGETDERK